MLTVLSVFVSGIAVLAIAGFAWKKSKKETPQHPRAIAKKRRA